MCGFVGFIDKGAYDSESTIRTMADTIAHRGPDGEGYYQDDSIALGFRRLAIIDLAGGDQPLYNEDRSLVLCFNGEIYNHQELRNQLQAAGHHFYTNTDSEVILHGFEAWGAGLLPRLRGMFAVVVWDNKHKQLFAARDRFGIKPFYFAPLSPSSSPSSSAPFGLGFSSNPLHQSCQCLVFGSEIKGILPHPKVRRCPNSSRLAHFLSFEYLPDHETLFEGIYKLPAGHWLQWQSGELTLSRWTAPQFSPEPDLGIEEAQTHILESLNDSVAAHSIADVEVGSFLSSGVDSSLIAYLASQSMNLQTFTVGFAEPTCSEVQEAQRFAQDCGLEAHGRMITPQAFFEAVPSIIYALDEPLPNPSTVPLWFLTHFAAESVKVVLSGEGADELFGGYPLYQECIPYHRWMKVPAPLRLSLGSLAARMPPFHGRRFLMRGRYDLPSRYGRASYVFSPEELEILLPQHHEQLQSWHQSTSGRSRHVPEHPCISPPTSSCGTYSPAALVAPCFSDSASLDEVAATQQADLQTWLAEDILLKADKMSMAASLELRVPFLDSEVMAVAARLPLSLRLNQGQTKWALRQAASHILPAYAANQPKKGFLTPLASWLKTDPWYSLVRETITSTHAQQLFNSTEALRLLEEHRQGRRNGMRRIWALFCLTLWYEEFFIQPPMPQNLKKAAFKG